MLERGRSSFPYRTANIWLATRSEWFTNARKVCWEKYRKFHCISTSVRTQKDPVIVFWSSLILVLGVLPCLVNSLGGMFLTGLVFFYYYYYLLALGLLKFAAFQGSISFYASLSWLRLNIRHFSERDKSVDDHLYDCNIGVLFTHSFFFLFYLLLQRHYFHLKALQSHSFLQHLWAFTLTENMLIFSSLLI